MSLNYAQNFEEVTIWRSFKPFQNGVYFDVGAQLIVKDSIFRAFYVSCRLNVGLPEEKDQENNLRLKNDK